jgi:hypothetical protein
MPFITKDVAAGVTFLLIGLVGFIVARGYDMGTARVMGPGYFPTILCAGLMLLGVIIFAQGVLSSARETLERIHWRPLVLVSLAILLFSLLLEPAGLIIASVVLIGLCSYAGREARWQEVLILGAGLIVFCSLVFVWGVKLPVTLLPG